MDAAEQKERTVTAWNIGKVAEQKACSKTLSFAAFAHHSCVVKTVDQPDEPSAVVPHGGVCEECEGSGHDHKTDG